MYVGSDSLPVKQVEHVSAYVRIYSIDAGHTTDVAMKTRIGC